jgi:predicted nucleic acid-binding protein
VRAVLDANVLVPILSCDLLLTAARQELFQPVWSPAILEEVTRNIIKINPDLDPERLMARVAAMSNAFPAASLSEWEPVPSVVNEKDQHILSVALVTKADVVVTDDAQLRRQLRADGRITAQRLDEFLESQATDDPEGWAGVVDAMARRRRNPPIDQVVLLASIERGHPQFATVVRPIIGYPSW